MIARHYHNAECGPHCNKRIDEVGSRIYGDCVHQMTDEDYSIVVGVPVSMIDSFHDDKNDYEIMRARTLATGRGANPPMIQRNVLALEVQS